MLYNNYLTFEKTGVVQDVNEVSFEFNIDIFSSHSKLIIIVNSF